MEANDGKRKQSKLQSLNCWRDHRIPSLLSLNPTEQFYPIQRHDDRSQEVGKTNLLTHNRITTDHSSRYNDKSEWKRRLPDQTHRGLSWTLVRHNDKSKWGRGLTDQRGPCWTACSGSWRTTLCCRGCCRWWWRSVRSWPGSRWWHVQAGRWCSEWRPRSRKRCGKVDVLWGGRRRGSLRIECSHLQKCVHFCYCTTRGILQQNLSFLMILIRERVHFSKTTHEIK